MGRAPCCEKVGLKKGPWTPEEDRKLIDYIQKNGHGNWRTLPKNAGLQRCGKSCRLRWTNYLRPDIKRGRFSFEEEEAIIQLHSILGNKWSAIAARLPGRTDNEIKNYWNTHIRKRLLRMGIDPVTHSPRLDLLNLSTIQNSLTRINFSSLSGLQPYINPELIRLASSLLSSQLPQSQDFLIPRQLISDNPQSHNPSLIQTCQMQNPAQDIPIPNHGQAHYDDVEQFQPNLAGFGSESCRENDWQQSSGSLLSTNLTEDFSPVTNYGFYGLDQPVMDPNPSSEASTRKSDSSNNFSFQSVLSDISTRSSSPTPLQSDSTYSINSNVLKFEIPEIPYVNAFNV